MEFVKFVALIGFASVANANHACWIPGTQTSVGGCFPDCGSLTDITEFVDDSNCEFEFCCSKFTINKEICPPCESGCDENFYDPTCITFDDYLEQLETLVVGF